jgi:hypothetical protein
MDFVQTIESAERDFAEGHFIDAEQKLRDLLESDQRNSVVHNNLANVLRASGRVQDAVDHYLIAATENPVSAEIRNNLAKALDDLGLYERAEEEYRAAIALKPDFADAKFNLGLLLLASGNYTEGWRYYEARTQLFKEFGTLPFPKWEGEDLRGKSLLIFTEQGYGDIIQLIRYVALVRERGVATVSVVCKPEIAPVVRTTGTVDAVLTNPQSIEHHDVWIPLLSLPFLFDTTIASIPAKVPYLGVFSNRVDEWRPRLPQNGIKVGLVWKGNPHHDNDRHRSLRHFADLSPLWSVNGVSFVSLQVGEAESETVGCQQQQPVVPLGSQIRDFGDTAAIVAQLNLVICVDTAIAHLAGALGIACWVMLPAIGVDWRWQRAGSSSLWYPEGMYLFRQRDNGWAGVIEDLRLALSEVMKSGGGEVQTNR